MTPEQHLAHLKALIAPPFTNGWWAYAKARAGELAMQDSANVSIPILLQAEWNRIDAEARALLPPPRRASSVKQTAQRAIVSRETKPAPTHTPALKASTGQPAFS
ncbi:hypothetical protein D3C71_1584740 [compost metagenome]